MTREEMIEKLADAHLGMLADMAEEGELHELFPDWSRVRASRILYLQEQTYDELDELDDEELFGSVNLENMIEERTDTLQSAYENWLNEMSDEQLKERLKDGDD